ncbi:MAG: TonB-dependent receptor plug domain-containing protein [Gemmatimonadales bacterium]|nr:TonB-dependent receptor plug domain-containing protein [Gemmatimonadales bacterium]
MVDAETGEPVLVSAVILIDAAGVTRAGGITDSAGGFRLWAPEPGTYSIRADAKGYTTLVSPPFRLKGEETIELELRVSGEVEQLEPVVVTGEAQPFAPGPLRGFWERKRRGFGQFVTREEIEKSGAVYFTDVLRMVPSVRVVRNPRLNPFSAHSQYTVRIVGYGNCQPVLYLDGIKLGKIDEVTERGPDVFLSPHDLEAIEVYRVSEVPGEFGGSDARCGVIVVWTKRSP